MNLSIFFFLHFFGAFNYRESQGALFLVEKFYFFLEQHFFSHILEVMSSLMKMSKFNLTAGLTKVWEAPWELALSRKMSQTWDDSHPTDTFHIFPSHPDILFLEEKSIDTYFWNLLLQRGRKNDIHIEKCNKIHSIN